MRQSGFDFPIGTYRFLFRGRGVLPAGFGLAQWRGQIGLALYRAACMVEAPDCLQIIEHGIPARDPTLAGELARFGCLDHAAGQWRWSEGLTRLSIPPPATSQAGWTDC